VIRYALLCAAGHTFESWFANSAAFDKQVKRDLVACPECGSTEVEKALMAPALSRAARAAKSGQPKPATASEGAPAAEADKAPVAMLSDQERELRGKLRELHDHLTRNADYVGGKFPEEARRMHYGEIEHRSIYGEASMDEAKSLHEEGVQFYPLPRLPDDRN